MKIYADFRLKIKELISEAEISLWKLARDCDIHPQTLYNYMDGKSELGADKLERVFQVLNETIRSKPR